MQNREFCALCDQYYEGFCKCQTTVIQRVLDGEKVSVYIGHASPAAISLMRQRLQLAALAKWPNANAVPIEILTLPAGFGETSFLVRRFV